MQRISGFIISLLLLFPVLCSGQDTIRYPIEPMKGIRIGIDVSKLLLPVIYNKDNKRMGFEASADMHIKNNWFGTVEAGWLTVDLKNDTAYHYKSTGFYAKAGADYNLLKSRRPHSNDLVYAGFRYATSVFTHEVTDVTIPGYYWPDAEGQSSSRNTLNAHWMEILFGIRAEILKNFYVGLTVRGSFMLVKPKDDYSVPYLIPGFGKGDVRFVFGLNYYLSYNIRF